MFFWTPPPPTGYRLINRGNSGTSSSSVRFIVCLGIFNFVKLLKTLEVFRGHTFQCPPFADEVLSSWEWWAGLLSSRFSDPEQHSFLSCKLVFIFHEYMSLNAFCQRAADP